MGLVQLSLLLCAALFIAVESLPGGPPVSACDTITPNQFAHSAVSQDLSTNPYSVDFGQLAADGSVYTPGQTYTFTVSADVNTTQFRGFFVQARDPLTNSLVGGFAVQDASTTQLSLCTVPDSGVTHNNNNDKTSVSFQWTAPDSPSVDVEFRFSVVQVRIMYWANDAGILATAPQPDPPVVTFINDSPMVEDGAVDAEFEVESSATVTVECQLLTRLEGDSSASIVATESCGSGSVTFSDLDPGIYRLRIVATDEFGQQGVMRKRIVIPDFEEDQHICSVNLINEGAVVTDDSVTVSFATIGLTTGFLCRLDVVGREPCESPYTLTGLTAGAHRIKIKPLFPTATCLGLNRRRPLVVRFTV